MALAESAPETPPKRPINPTYPICGNMPEFTWSAVMVGAVLGIVFGASSLYLVLRSA